MTDPILLQCPKCKGRRDNVNLGSVNQEGYIIMKRQYGRFTAIMATDYSVICDCGYTVHVHDGRIEMGALTGLPVND